MFVFDLFRTTLRVFASYKRHEEVTCLLPHYTWSWTGMFTEQVFYYYYTLLLYLFF